MQPTSPAKKVKQAINLTTSRLSFYKKTRQQLRLRPGLSSKQSFGSRGRSFPIFKVYWKRYRKFVFVSNTWHLLSNVNTFNNVRRLHHRVRVSLWSIFQSTYTLSFSCNECKKKVPLSQSIVCCSLVLWIAIGFQMSPISRNSVQYLQR